MNESFPKPALVFLDSLVDIESIISFITEIELLVRDPPEPGDLKVYRSFVTQASVIGLQDGLIQETIKIRKLYKLKLPDALIPATALKNDLGLIADNDKDFLLIPDLKYLNPQHSNK